MSLVGFEDWSITREEVGGIRGEIYPIKNMTNHADYSKAKEGVSRKEGHVRMLIITGDRSIRIKPIIRESSKL